ncbi:hypothetical protein M409DRAFT_60239 [Zasmidium cellare ATCC 36951]|uniref:NAD(P)-binding protein n=1 Tax=Zasmidium cellare ATCC 36951 TaxID=1080233 RepID=A0A6A6C2P2_ZASCE|nr:uncharacterized protein M409DRAFT_60239 [Zasmidium cellare ATCC 36951]KAF2160132.1 hypothetical protein M409DRAFT_60239 [Zasmidium cellare ATCC 36951]
MTSSPSKYIRNPNNLPSPVPTFHSDTYPRISPLQNPTLRLPGKHVIITGGGSGIGRETVFSFARAGVANITLFGGRRGELLEETKALVERQVKGVEVRIWVGDICDEEGVKRAVDGVKGGWDVLVLNSGYLSEKGKLGEADVGDWWKAFEISLKGSLVVLQALLPHRKPNASVLSTNSLVINYQYPERSSYIVSKLALARMMECLAQEEEDLYVVSFHPGGVDTDMYNKFFGDYAATQKAKTGTDTLQLPADFAVWLASPEARFLRGRFVYANWDVDELKQVCEERFEKEPDFLKANVIGWPFSPP